MTMFWISIFLIFPVLVMVVTLAMCKSASVADRNMELLRTADYKTRSITAERHDSPKEFKGSAEEQTTVRLRQSGVQS